MTRDDTVNEVALKFLREIQIRYVLDGFASPAPHDIFWDRPEYRELLDKLVDQSEQSRDRLTPEFVDDREVTEDDWFLNAV